MKTLKGILQILLLLVILLPVTTYFMLKLPQIQTYIIQKITDEISLLTKTKVSIKSVNYKFFKNLVLEDLFIEDTEGDTLLNAAKVDVSLANIWFSQKRINFSSVVLTDGQFNLITTNDTLNLDKLLSRLSSGNEQDEINNEQTQQGYSIFTSRLQLQNFRFSLQNRDSIDEEIPEQINFENLQISRINLTANNIRFAGDTVFFNISNLSFYEKSGFHLNLLTTGKNSYVCSHRAYLPNLEIVDDYTNLKFDYYAMNFPNGSDDLDDYLNKVRKEAFISGGYLNFKTIGFFAHALAGTNIVVAPRGKIDGTVANMHTENFSVINAQGFTGISGNISFAGLPDIDSTKFTCDNLTVNTNVTDLNKTLRQIINSNANILDYQFKTVKNAGFSGKLNGFYNNFSLNGLLTTNLGAIHTNATFDFSSVENDVEVTGSFVLNGFDLGRFANSDILEKVSANIKMRGVQPKNKDFNLYAEGNISEFVFNERKYSNIDFAGTLLNNAFDGKIVSSDESLKFDFLGRIDMTKTERDDYRFNFTANINHADLYRLNLKTDDTASVFSGIIVADLRGKNINMGGNLRLQNAKYQDSRGTVDIGNVHLQALQENNNHKIMLQSAYLDAEYKGNANVEKFIQDEQNLISKYFPNLFNNSNSTSDSRYELKVTAKKMQALMQILNPEIFIAENSTVNIIQKGDKASIGLKSDFISIDGIMLKNISIKGNSDSVFLFETDCSEAIAGGITFQNININSNVADSKISSFIRYDSKASIKNRGNINLQAQLLKDSNEDVYFRFKINPSQIILNDIAWNFVSGNMQIKENYYEIEKFEATSGSQKILLNGTYSLESNNALRLELTDFNIENFNPVFEAEGYKFSGNISGRARINHRGGYARFVSNMQTGDIFANGWLLGKISLETRWDDKARQMNFLTKLTKNNSVALNVQGSYLPSKDYYNLTFNAQKMDIKIVEPLIADEINNIQGGISGILNMKGTGNKLNLTGNAMLDTLGFTVNFLKTHYTVSTPVIFSDNKIQIQNAVLLDEQNNKGNLNATVTHKNLKDFVLDINLNTNNLLGLKTTESDNEEFYGNAYISGPVRMHGTLNELKFNINIRPEKNTRITIPVSSASISQKTFLTFESVDSVTEMNEIDKFIAQLKKNKEDNIEQSDLDISLALTMNNNAEVNLVLDDNTGDAITGKGSGVLQMSINPREEKFTLRGIYTIDNGNFKWTLPMLNFMTKEFNISNGSQIHFSGDMNQTKVNITAYYTRQLQLSLQTLLSDTTINRIKYPVVCGVQLTGNISNLSIKPLIEIQNIDIDTKARAESMLNTDEKLWKQFVFLLVSGNFLAEEQMGNVVSNVSITSNLSEILSNQLSAWLSSLKLPVDLGVDFRTGNTSTETEFDAHASVKMFDDRVVVSGRVGSAPRTSTSDVVGDFDVDIKLNQSGSLQTKIFSRATDEYTGDAETSRQGVKISYQGGFNTWTELWNSIFRPKQARERRERIRRRQAAIQDSINAIYLNVNPTDSTKNKNVP